VHFPNGVTLTIRTGSSSAEDIYGDSTATSPTDTAWGPCALAPRTSTERADNRTPAVVTALTIYGPQPGPTSGARVVIPSGTYAGTWEVEGIPGEWTSPFTGWAPGVEVAVKRASAVTSG
jgi:hypothetical protein